MRLIDAEHLLEVMKESNFTMASKKLIKSMPVVDAVPVVRCKDCLRATMTSDNKLCKYCEFEMDEYSNPIAVYHEADYYCANGERKVSE